MHKNSVNTTDLLYANNETNVSTKFLSSTNYFLNNNSLEL